MSDNFIRHFIAFVAMLVCGLAWWAGFMAGKSGWWWTVFGITTIYLAVYKLLDM